MRSVLIGPVPSRTFPDTFQLPPVSPGFLHRRALEGDHSFVEGEITLESYQLILRIYDRGPHRGDEVALRLIDGDFRQRYRCYRSNNLAGTRVITCRILGRASGRWANPEATSPKITHRNSGRSGC